MKLVTVRHEKLRALTGVHHLLHSVDDTGQPETIMAGFKVCRVPAPSIVF